MRVIQPENRFLACVVRPVPSMPSYFVGDAMAEYRLLTIWRIGAPLDEVYTAIHNSSS